MPVRASAMALPPAFPVCAIVPSNRAWVGPAAAGAPEAPRHRRMAPRTISSTDSVQVPCEQSGFRVAVTRVGSTGLAPRLGATLMTACHAEDEYCQGTSLTRPRDSCFIFIRQDSRQPLAEARKGKTFQHVMAVRIPPAHTRSSYRKRVNFNC